MPKPATTTSRIADINGFWEVENNPISKAGVFMYSGKALCEFFPELIETEFYPVFRSPEVLSDPECINSFKLQPWVDNHPKLLLGDPAKGGIDPKEKGIEGVIGEKVYYDPEDMTLKGNLKIFSFTHDKRIDEGKRELSLGYRCKYKKVDGEYAGQNYMFMQYDIRGNHLASVDVGRMGQDVAVMDGFTFTVDSQEFKMPTPAKKSVAKKPAPKLNRIAAAVAGIMAYTADAAEGAVEGDTGEISAAVEIMKKVKPLLDQLSALTSVSESAAMEPEDAVGDGGEGAVVAADADAEGAAAAAGEKKDDKKDGAAMDAAEIQRLIAAGVAEAMKPFAPKITAAMDAGEMMREISARDALARKLSPFIGTFDHAEMTHAQVAEYGVKKLELTVPKGQEIIALNGYLHGRSTVRIASGTAMDAADQTSLAAVEKLLGL